MKYLIGMVILCFAGLLLQFSVDFSIAYNASKLNQQAILGNWYYNFFKNNMHYAPYVSFSMIGSFITGFGFILYAFIENKIKKKEIS